MGGLIGRHRSIAIDTNLLLVLLAYDYIEHSKPTDVMKLRILDDLRGRGREVPLACYTNLWMLFERASRRVVTQHVIAEVHNLQKRVPVLRTGWSSFWDAGARLVRDNQVEELPCTVADLDRHEAFRVILREIGPTDAGLLFVAPAK